jgi:hypothetical protein
MTLVAELRRWIEDNRCRLASNHVTVTDKLPSREDNKQSKGCVGLSKDHIIVSFTAWERTLIPTELIVYNTHLGKTIIAEDESKASVKAVIDALNDITNNLIAGQYDDMKPSPELTIS